MSKLIIVSLLIFLQATATTAQKTSDPAKADTKSTPVMKIPVKTQIPRIKTTPQPVPATTSAQNSNNFYLTSAKVTIYTGNDNKEAPSQVQIQMTLGTEGICSIGEHKEFPVNSVTELPLKSFYDRSYYPEKLRLINAETAGVKLYIHYVPKFLLDAWKIEKVMLTLEFRDDNGNLHPVVGTKNILFTNVNAVLNDKLGTLACEADKIPDAG